MVISDLTSNKKGLTLQKKIFSNQMKVKSSKVESNNSNKIRLKFKNLQKGTQLGLGF